MVDDKKHKAKQREGGAQVHNYEKERSKGMGVRQIDEKGMREMSDRTARHPRQRMPVRRPAAHTRFFPTGARALALGAAIGMLAGIAWAALLLNGMVIIPGWEGLFSMTPFAYTTFWAVIGASLFGVLFSAAAIIISRSLK